MHDIRDWLPGHGSWAEAKRDTRDGVGALRRLAIHGDNISNSDDPVSEVSLEALLRATDASGSEVGVCAELRRVGGVHFVEHQVLDLDFEYYRRFTQRCVATGADIKNRKEGRSPDHAWRLSHLAGRNKLDRVEEGLSQPLHVIGKKGILTTMAAGKCNGQVLRDELERVLSSTCFARVERTSKLLRFLVEQQLEGRESELKESIIGVEVFGRPPDYDPKVDSTVRTEAVRLRARLSKYYSTEGSQDPIVIDLPKGGYVPTFRQPEPLPDMKAPRPQPRLWLAAGLTGFALIAAAAGVWWALHKNAPIAIAVLPLSNLSEDTANDYFADGLTNEIIRNLSIIDGLAVRSQTSSFVFKGKPQNVREAGKQLGADYILEGSVLRAEQHLRINTQLIRVRDDFPLWSSRFDRELTDVFAIQDEIARGIVNSLRLKVGGGRRRYETNPEAYDLYLRVRALELQRGFEAFRDSVNGFNEVIAKDASFAPAYAGLAACHAARSGLFRFNQDEEMSRMRTAAQTALRLDPLLAEAHDALGMVHARDAHWEESEKSFRRAIEINPSRSESHAHYAMYLLFPLRRMKEAFEQVRVAERADPLSPMIQIWLAVLLISTGQFNEAADHCEKQPADFDFRDLCLGRARLGQGRTGEAIQILETALNDGVSAGSEIRGELGYAYARAGRHADAKRLADSTPSLNPFNRALIFAGLGDKERTIEALELAATGGPFRIGRALTFPEFALLRDDPRAKALRHRVGLPE